jgi:hypothetical protein
VEIRHLLLSDTRITLTSLLDMATGINANIQRVGTSVEVSQTEVRRDMANLVMHVEKALDLDVRSGGGTVNIEEVCQFSLFFVCTLTSPSSQSLSFVKTK